MEFYSGQPDILAASVRDYCAGVLNRARALDPVSLRIELEGGGEGAITLRYAWFSPSFGSHDKSRDAVGLNANARFAIIKDYHGIIFSRNGRIIDVQTRTPWTVFINNDRYIKLNHYRLMPVGFRLE